MRFPVTGRILATVQISVTSIARQYSWIHTILLLLWVAA